MKPVAAALMLVALALSGCVALDRPVPEPLAAPAAPAAFKEVDGRWAAFPAADSQPGGPWWTVFHDPALDALVESANRVNTDIGRVRAQLAQAQAVLRAADADRRVQIAFSAGATRQTGTPSAGPRAFYEAGAVASWPLDPSGRLARASEAALLDVSSREATLQSARLSTQALVVQGYFALRAVDAERELLRDTIDVARDLVRLTERRRRAGDLAELDLARSQAEVAGTEAQAFALERRRAELENALSTLAGVVPSALAIAPAEWAGTLPQIPPGIPSSVLARRPDIAAAQRSMEAARLRVGLARSAWFPDLSLTAAGGLASADVGDLLKWSSRAWGVGALLSLPLFDGGRREAGLDLAAAQWDLAANGYRERVLAAFREVEDHLSALRLLALEADAQARAVESATRATQLSHIRYRHGRVSQLELLDARRSELISRRSALHVRVAQYQATVGLIRSLGGDWGSRAKDAAP